MLVTGSRDKIKYLGFDGIRTRIANLLLLRRNIDDLMVPVAKLFAG